MDYKEKLRLAKEALDSGSYDKDTIEYIFPELKENKNEKVKKSLIRLVKSFYDVNFPTPEGFTKEQLLSWLEKQGEQKYTQRDIDDAYLKGIADVKREVKKIDEQTEKMKKEIAEFIFNSKEYIKQRYEWIKCLGFDVKFSNEEKQGEQKSTDKVEPKDYNNIDPHFAKPIDKVEQKPAEWSEEDEKYLKLAIENFQTLGNSFLTSWLKNLKDRVYPQPKQNWSEEDERLFQIVIDILDRENHFGNISHTDLIACVRKLKSLKPQNTWKPSDEQMYNLSEAAHYRTPFWDCDILIGLYDELKKLRKEQL